MQNNKGSIGIVAVISFIVIFIIGVTVVNNIKAEVRDPYKKDENHVYVRGQIISGADVRTFRSIWYWDEDSADRGDSDAKDKNYFYSRGEITGKRNKFLRLFGL